MGGKKSPICLFKYFRKILKKTIKVIVIKTNNKKQQLKKSHETIYHNRNIIHFN